jgi:hypothetical protein
MKAREPYHHVDKLDPKDAWSLLKKQVCMVLPFLMFLLFTFLLVGVLITELSKPSLCWCALFMGPVHQWDG